MKCTYCQHEYPQEVRDDLHRMVFAHVYANHPERWRMVKPSDVWTTKVGS